MHAVRRGVGGAGVFGQKENFFFFFFPPISPAGFPSFDLPAVQGILVSFLAIFPIRTFAKKPPQKRRAKKQKEKLEDVIELTLTLTLTQS